MIANKIVCFGLATILLGFSFGAEAQQAKRIPRIGFLSGTSASAASARVEGFRTGLRELGYVEGKNIFIEYRYAEADQDRISSFVAELVQSHVDVLVIGVLPGIRAAKQATKTIPIVMVTTVDPVAAGIVESLARPGGNITGVTRLTRDLSGKRLELLQETVPGISRVAVIWDANGAASAIASKEYESAGRLLKIHLQSLEVRGPNPDLEGAFQAAVNAKASGVITVRGALLNRYTKRLADLAIKNRLSSMYEGSEYVQAGGLMSYSANDVENFRRAAYYVDRILKGTKPADLPVEQPMKFEFIINLKAAKQIGLTIPPNVLARADRVIK
jgi:putative tryptophan/tyrosine transport system substrate-binding protein